MKISNRYIPTPAPIPFSEKKPNVLDVLTSGVIIKHDVTVTLSKAERQTILGAVGILAGAALLAVMLARK
jgi:hypothetical protein